MRRILIALLLLLLCIPVGGAPATATTVFPLLDGDIGTNSNPTWEGARTIADCVDCSTNGYISAESSVGLWNGSPLYSVIRGVLYFDTSFLGEGATVISATLSVKATVFRFDYTGNDFIRLVGHTITSGYTADDYGLIGSSPLASDIPVSWMSKDQYASFALNSAGLAAINKTGLTRFGLRTGIDISNTEPQIGTDEMFPDKGGTLVFFYSSENGTNNGPKLTITYTSASVFSISINATATEGTAPLTVGFGLNGLVDSVVWKLDGTQFSTALNPSLTFTEAGNYRIDATAQSGSDTATATVFITVTACSCD